MFNVSGYTKCSSSLKYQNERHLGELWRLPGMYQNGAKANRIAVLADVFLFFSDDSRLF